MFKHPKSNLTIDEIAIEINKITNVTENTGFLHFLLNYVIVEHPKGACILGDEIFNWQRKAAVEFLKSRYIISKKVRQVGYSTLVGAYCLWRALFFSTQMINIVSLRLMDATTFLRRVKFIYDHLPVWMKQGKSEDQKTSITFEHNNSKITSLPLTTDPGRGETLSLLVLDEFAAMKNAKQVLAAGVPSLAAGSTIPFTNESLPSQLFVISTYPHEAPHSNEYVRLLNGARKGEESNFAVIEVDPGDIPYYNDPVWIKEQLELLGQHRFNIEIMGIEPIDSENTFVPDYVLQNLKSESPKRCDFLYPNDVDDEGYYKDLNILSEMRDNFDEQFHYIKSLWIWEDPIEGHQYCITVDVAAGKQGDHSAFIVMDLMDNSQVAEYKSNRIDTENFKKIIEIVAEYYNHSKVSVENNGMGVAICDYFEKTLNYDLFYMHRKSRSNYISGFPMTVTTRGQALINMNSLLHNGELKLRSMRIIDEIRSFGYDARGRLQALGDAHDDLVMALAQFSFLVTIGWAISDLKAMSELPFGPFIAGQSPLDQMTEEQIKELNLPKIPNGVKRYFDDGFDADTMLSDQEKEFLALVKATGSGISIEDLQRITRKDIY